MTADRLTSLLRS